MHWTAMAGAMVLSAVAHAGTSPTFDTRNGPVAWNTSKDGAVTISAPAKTNWFIAPLDLKIWDSAPMLLFTPADEFALSAKVRVEPKSRWDGGALVLFVNPTTWAKLCVEASDGPGNLKIVSVVTNGVSDDSYSIPVTGEAMFLKVAKIGSSFLFFISADGSKWQMVRNFRFNTSADLKVGYSAQSPTGKGTQAVFSEIRYQPERIADMFAGQ